MTDEEKRIVAVLRQWEDSLVLFGKGHQRCVRDLGKAANMIEKLSSDRDALNRRCKAAERVLIGWCDVCANEEECVKYPCYCINGSAWKLKDLCAENGQSQN